MDSIKQVDVFRINEEKPDLALTDLCLDLTDIIMMYLAPQDLQNLRLVHSCFAIRGKYHRNWSQWAQERFPIALPILRAQFPAASPMELYGHCWHFGLLGARRTFSSTDIGRAPGPGEDQFRTVSWREFFFGGPSHTITSVTPIRDELLVALWKTGAERATLVHWFPDSPQDSFAIHTSHASPITYVNVIRDKGLPNAHIVSVSRCQTVEVHRTLTETSRVLEVGAGLPLCGSKDKFTTMVGSWLLVHRADRHVVAADVLRPGSGHQLQGIRPTLMTVVDQTIWTVEDEWPTLNSNPTIRSWDLVSGEPLKAYQPASGRCSIAAFDVFVDIGGEQYMALAYSSGAVQVFGNDLLASPIMSEHVDYSPSKVRLSQDRLLVEGRERSTVETLSDPFKGYVEGFDWKNGRSDYRIEVAPGYPVSLQNHRIIAMQPLPEEESVAHWVAGFIGSYYGVYDMDSGVKVQDLRVSARTFEDKVRHRVVEGARGCVVADESMIYLWKRALTDAPAWQSDESIA